MISPVPEHDLLALIEGELAPDRAAQVREALRADPEGRRLVEAMERDRSLLRASLARDHSRGPIGLATPALAEALRAYTATAAYQLHRESEIGALAPGLRGDFLVLDANPFGGAPDAISELRVLETWMDGVRVYAAEEGGLPPSAPPAAPRMNN